MNLSSCPITSSKFIKLSIYRFMLLFYWYLTVILRGSAGYELIYITNEVVVFPYLVKLNDIGSYHGLREPVRKLENHYPELKIY